MSADLTTTISRSLVSSEIMKSLSGTAKNIASQNFDWRFATLVVFNSSLLFGVEEFLRSYGKVVFVSKGTFYPKFVHQTRQYVIFETSLVNIAQELQWMKNHEFDNTGKFIIVCLSQECDETAAMQVLWHYKITNVVFLKYSSNEVDGYTYLPVNDHRCSNSEPIKLDLQSCFEYTSLQCNNVFSVKLTTLHGCNIIASTFIQMPYMNIIDGKPIGADGDLLLLIAEALNASLTMMTPRFGTGWGKKEQNGSWSGSLADVLNDYANFSMTSAALTISRFSSFQMSIDYNTAAVVWVTHPAKLIPSSLKLIHPFQLSSRLALVFSFIFVILCSLVVKSRLWETICRAINVRRPRSSVAFYSWMICMGLPSTKLPSKTALLYVVLLWMWYGVLMRTFYQVSLITVLKANYYFGDFNTIEEVIEANYPFGGGDALKDYFIDYPLVYKKWTSVKTEDIVPCVRQLSQGLEFVIAMNVETAMTLVSSEDLPIHILRQIIVRSPTVIFFKKFSPLAEAVNRILVRLIESGLVDKLHRNHAGVLRYTKETNTLGAIKMEHYTGCYMILLSGWLISFLLFMAEITVARLHLRLPGFSYMGY